MKPMLAKKFSELRTTYPCLMQPKLDGIRALSVPGQATLQSRPKPPDFKLIYWTPGVLGEIETQLNQLRQIIGNQVVLDGELYCHGMSLQQINSRVAVNRTTPHKDIDQISYHIFDFLDPKDHLRAASLRADILNNWSELHKSKFSKIHFVQHIYCSSKNFSNLTYRYHLSEGYEGSMYRRLDAAYATYLTCGNQENRTWDLQKRKLSQDVDCIIVGLIESDKRPGHLKGFEVQSPDGNTFLVGTGYSIAERKDYWERGEECIGGIVKVIFRTLSDANLPLEPRASLVTLPKQYN